MLRDCGFVSGLSNFGSHSLKATLLTYTGKFGLSTADRQLLGYHVVKGESNALNYNRDNLSKPMEGLVECLKWVRNGGFAPDEPRGRRLKLDQHKVPAVKQM